MFIKGRMLFREIGVDECDPPAPEIVNCCTDERAADTLAPPFWMHDDVDKKTVADAVGDRGASTD